MTWSYSGDPSSSDKDAVRFLVQDTDNTLELLTDEEIEYLITQWAPAYGSNTYVAAVAAAVISRKFAGVVTISADGVSISGSDLSRKYTDMAVQLRAEYAEESAVGATVDLSNIEIAIRFDPSIAPLNFSVGMHDNARAGQQAYGGWLPEPEIEWARG